MRATLLLPATILLAACASLPPLTPPPPPPLSLAPSLSPPPPLSLAPSLTPSPPPSLPVLQAIPPSGLVAWSGAGGALAVTGRGCETSIVDVDAARVTARIAACQVWSSPSRDVFLAHMEDGSLVMWDRRGARGARVASQVSDWSSLPGRVRWSADGATATLLEPADATPRVADPDGVSPAGPWRAREETIGARTSVDVRDVATGKRVLRLAGMREPHWSADGAYLSARSDEKTPRLVVVAAGRWEEVWRRDGRASGSWSSSGARLAVTSSEIGLEVLDATTGSTRPMPGAATAAFERLYQAPDGALMAPMVPLDDAAMHAVRIELGGEASIVDVPAGARDPGWSPDGERVAVRRATEPNVMMASWRLFVDDRTTGEHAFVDHGFGGFDALWSARASRLLVVRGGGPFSDAALLYDARTRQVWRVPVTQAFAAAIDGDGRRAALATPGGLEVVTLGSKAPSARLAAPSDPAPALLAFSGSRLAAVTREGDVSVWDVDRRELVASWKEAFVPFHAAWVGEGRRLALSRGERLRLSDPDGSRAVTLTALTGPEGTRLVANPR